jgi:hypothetical protein
VAVLAALGLHALDKLRLGLLWEMLWSCHVASLCIALGIFLRWPRWAAAGMLFHLAVGIPGYVLDAVVTWPTRPTSVLVHTVPALAGWVMARRYGFPRRAAWDAFAGLLLLQGVSYAITPPALNINLVFRPWTPFAEVFRGVFWSQLPNLALSLALLLVWERIARRLLGGGAEGGGSPQAGAGSSPAARGGLRG